VPAADARQLDQSTAAGLWLDGCERQTGFDHALEFPGGAKKTTASFTLAAGYTEAAI